MATSDRDLRTPPKPTDATGAWQLHGQGVAPLVVLAGIVLALSWVFFQMVRPMILPLFLAAVLAMLVHPWHEKLLAKLRGREWLSALIFTLLFSAFVFVPAGIGLFYGVSQALELVKATASRVGGPEKILPQPTRDPRLASLLQTLQSKLHVDVEQLEDWAVQLGKAAAKTLYDRSVGFAGDLPGFVVAIFIFLFAFYFFLRDGRRLISAWQRLTPMEASHERVMRQEFAVVCRAVVWGTLLAAIAQGLLFGIGVMVMEMFFHIGTLKWISLLSLLATIAAMIPFVGSAVVWVPLSIYLCWIDHWWAGAIFFVYGAAVISTADNLVKIQTLGDGANLHPLLVFVSVFGGIQMFGVLGMFIGPIVAAVMFALLRVLKQELLRRQLQPA